MSLNSALKKYFMFVELKARRLDYKLRISVCTCGQILQYASIKRRCISVCQYFNMNTYVKHLMISISVSPYFNVSVFQY